MINIAVLDDELELIYTYEIKIAEILNKNNIEGSLIVATNSVSKFLDIIKKQTVNVCILDIELCSTVTGMNIANELRKEEYPCEIIFLTSHFEYMKNAFDVQAFNFIQRPGWEDKAASKKTIGIKCGFDVVFIPYDDILCIEHIGTKTTIHTKNGGKHETYEGFEELVNRINDNRFKRCHRSIFISTNYLQKIDVSNKEIILTDGSHYKIGPKYYSTFQAWRDF